MRIVCPDKKTVHFCDIEQGNCFSCNLNGYNFYMKTEPIEIYDDAGCVENCYNAVELSTGNMYEMDADDTVFPVDMETRLIKEG